jgi:hypothetical protein
MSKHTMIRSAAAAALFLAGCTALASNIGLTLKLMDFDLANPQREEYADRNLGDALINYAINTAWEQQSQAAADGVRLALSGPDKLGSGMTARNIIVRLGEPQSPHLTVLDRVRGRLELTVPGDAVSLTTTHPLSRGPWMDPRLRISFSLNLVVEFKVISKAPFVQALTAYAQPTGVAVQALNLSADLGLSIDDIVSSLGGVQTIGEKIAGGMEQSKVNITDRFNSYLAGNAGLLALPPGYLFNGGRVEPTRVAIAAYRPSQPAPADIFIKATWPNSLGELMADCLPVGIGAQYQSGPHSLNGDAPPFAMAQLLTTAPRLLSTDGTYSCFSLVRVPVGAPLNISWARPVHVTASGPNNKYLQASVNANPQGWSNPIIVRANSTTFLLALSRHIGATGAGLQLNAAKAARVNPGDPVISRAKASARINPVDTARAPRATDASVQLSTTSASKALLNPQTLPPKAPNWGNVPGNNAALNPQPQPTKVLTKTKSSALFKAPDSALSGETRAVVQPDQVQQLQPH